MRSPDGPVERIRPFRDDPELALFRVVDLRPLRLVGAIDIHSLPPRKRVDTSIAFAVAVAGVLVAAQGRMNLRADVNTCCYRAGTAICAGVGGSGAAPACWPYNKP